MSKMIEVNKDDAEEIRDVVLELTRNKLFKFDSQNDIKK